VTEKVKGGELFDYITAHGPLPRSTSIRLFSQIVLALIHAHDNGVCHRDIKPENILLDDDLNVKLTDFGLSWCEKPKTLCRTACGSPHYASPEIVEGKAYDGQLSDIWSAGVVLFVMTTGRNAFDGRNTVEVLKKVRAGKFEIPVTVDSDIAHLIWRLMQVNPYHRLSLKAIKNHVCYRDTNYFAELIPQKVEPVKLKLSLTDRLSLAFKSVLESKNTKSTKNEKKEVAEKPSPEPSQISEEDPSSPKSVSSLVSSTSSKSLSYGSTESTPERQTSSSHSSDFLSNDLIRLSISS